MKLTALNLTEDMQEIDKLLSEGVISEGFADIARKALNVSGEVFKKLYAKGAVGSYEALQKLNSPVGRIAAVFAIGALGNMAMGAEEFVSNLSQMDGFDGALDTLQSIDQDSGIFDDQSMDALDSDTNEVSGLESNELSELKNEVKELEAQQNQVVKILKTVAMGDKSDIAVEGYLDSALDNILNSENNSDVVDNFSESAKYLKTKFSSGEELNTALKFLKKAAAIKIKLLDV